MVRQAGLPAEALAQLASPACLELAEELAGLATELAASRSSLAGLIAAGLAGFEPAERRFLLAVKRAAFNGRPLHPFAASRDWALLRGETASTAETIVALEQRLAARSREFGELYGRELDRERRHAASLGGDRRFLRGVALGRPGLVDKIRAKAPAIAGGPAPLGKMAKWERSLLRFITRGAGKLSTNSTLTVCGFGRLHGESSPAIRFLPGDRREISLVRVDRPHLEQLLPLITALPAVRESCFVAWNDSVEEEEPGRFSYLREEAWIYDGGARGFRLRERARARVRLENAGLPLLRELLADAPLEVGALLAQLAARAPEIDGRAALDQLMRLGLVLLMPPWPHHEPRLEQRLARCFRALPPQPETAGVLAGLEELVERQREFSSAERPEAAVRRIGESFRRLAAALLPPEAVPAAAEARGPEEASAELRLFEEVLVVAGGERPEILSLSAASAEEVLGVAGMVSRFASLFNPRHDLLHNLAAWWRGNEPGASSLPFAEVGRRFAPVWSLFQEFRRDNAGRPEATFDPFGTRTLAELAQRRGELLAEHGRWLAAAPDGRTFPPDDLARLIGGIPERYAPLLGASAFVQPAGAAGRIWVCNSLHEGSGRFFSRLTPVLEGELETRMLARLSGRSRLFAGGEEAELAEVKYPFGHLVRAHRPQTARVIEWRGVQLDLPRERRIRLAELRVEADLERETFRLLDRDGRRILPLHVSTLNEEMLPNLLRILLVFGPGEIRSVFPTAHCTLEGTTAHFRRLVCGSLVLRREAWAFDLAPLREQVAGRQDAVAHLAADAWRRGLGLPRLGYYYEKIQHGVSGGLKPQFVDFSSPSLVQLFVESALRREAPRMMLEEALPSPAEYPPDAEGRPRALELLLDSRVLVPGEEVAE